jgi:ubiquinone/menaquinone biosynthesis C-methylase UbiE
MPFHVDEYAAYLDDLYREQLARSGNRYLHAHSLTRAGILRQIQAARLYLPLVRGRVLDWGCAHAPDACLVRKYWGDQVELHGCDMHAADTDSHRVFHQACRIDYRQVDHPYALPHGDDFFDTVIGSGVLEHVPNDSESLKELYRVLRPEGLLVISFLPNAWSCLETVAQCFRLPHHVRSYTMGSARRLLLHSGFQPIYHRYMQMTPSLSGLAMVTQAPWVRRMASLLWKFNSLLESLWPLNRLASNLFLLARKRRVIAWDGAIAQETRRLRAA